MSDLEATIRLSWYPDVDSYEIAPATLVDPPQYADVGGYVFHSVECRDERVTRALRHILDELTIAPSYVSGGKTVDVMKRLEELENENAELRKDKERLDKIERMGFTRISRRERYLLPRQINFVGGKTIRAAIDATNEANQ